MKIINLIKSEFIKHYNIKRFVIIFIVLTLFSYFLVNFTNNVLDEYNNKNYEQEKNELFDSLKLFKTNNEKYKKKINKTLEEDYGYYLSKNYIQYLEMVKDTIKGNRDYKYQLITDELLPLVMKNYLIEEMNKNTNDNFIIDGCNAELTTREISETENVFGKEKVYINELCKYTNEEKNNIYKSNELNIKKLEELLNNNKYYLYLQYEVESGRIENDEMVQLLIDKKIEDNFNYLAINYIQYQHLNLNANMKVYTKDEYENLLNDLPHDSYEKYFQYHNTLKENAKKFQSIILYSTKNEIKHHTHYNMHDGINESEMYMNTKFKVDQVYHLSVIIMILVCITNGGIISNEHSKGTIKNLVTAPVRRWKILLSKFIYLLLDTYIMWMMGLIIISIIAGIKYGFGDLITPELVYTGNKVIEVNYYLYMLKEIFINTIPIVCFLTILFSLSALTLNTALTTGIMTTLSIISPFVWLANLTSLFKYITYTPIAYFDMGFIKNNSETYMNNLLEQYIINPKTVFIICLITSLAIYISTNIIYSKRDIKN